MPILAPTAAATLPTDGATLAGLTSAEARCRHESAGPNSLPDTTVSAWRLAVTRFWAPVPWMLEAAVVLELMLGRRLEAAIIAGLLTFNAGLGLYQERRAQATLAALKQRLALNTSVRRDGHWHLIPATELVVGDTVKLSLGGVVPADVELVSGAVLLDHSMLTGESAPVEAGAGAPSYAGALVQRGEGVALVTAIGAHTRFGRTAELVLTAHATSARQQAVLHVVRTGQAILTPTLIVIVMITGDFLGMALTTDRVQPSARPNAWHIGALTVAGAAMGAAQLVFCSALFAVGVYWLQLNLATLQTLAFVLTVFCKQAATYCNRERRHLWASRPSGWLLASSVADVGIATTLAVGAFAMAPLPAPLVMGTLADAATFALLLDAVKVPLLQRLGIAQAQA